MSKRDKTYPSWRELWLPPWTPHVQPIGLKLVTEMRSHRIINLEKGNPTNNVGSLSHLDAMYSVHIICIYSIAFHEDK